MATAEPSKLWDTSSPEEAVVALIQNLPPGATILDIGVLNGRHALYCVDQGFAVTAIDIDTNNIDRLRDNPRAVAMELVEADVRTYEPHQQFDAIICGMVLHFLPMADIAPTIKKIQKWTKSGGYNYVDAYTTHNPPRKRPYLFAPGELAAAYHDWELIDYREGPTPWFIKPGETEPRRNQAVYMIARKPQE